MNAPIHPNAPHAFNGDPPDQSAPAFVEKIIPFTARDGMPLLLTRIHSPDITPINGPILLVHGAGVRGKIFRPPEPVNFVRYLIEHRYEVWLEEWRASTEVPPNRWTLDQAALFDHPAAVEKVVEQSGADSIKAVIHCQGSTSFTMSAMAGLLPRVNTILSNAVSLHTIIPTSAKLKIVCAAPLLSAFTQYLNPQWGLNAPSLVPKFIDSLVRLTHHECDNPVCKWSSFTYGSGHPTLWRHENLTPRTHDWIKGEFGPVPLTFFRQMSRCVRRGNLVSMEHNPKLPEDFAAQSPQTDARFCFFTGEQNACFLAASQQATFDWFNRARPGFHSAHTVPGYGHLDMFIGEHAARDVFPLMLAALESRPAAVPPAPHA